MLLLSCTQLREKWDPAACPNGHHTGDNAFFPSVLPLAVHPSHRALPSRYLRDVTNRGDLLLPLLEQSRRITEADPYPALAQWGHLKPPLSFRSQHGTTQRPSWTEPRTKKQYNSGHGQKNIDCPPGWQHESLAQGGMDNQVSST